MNIASWLARAGLSHPDLPAAACGPLMCAPGDRVAIVAKNSPAYLELLYGIWHAGAAAVPANARLHGSELGYILDQSGARACFASPGLDGEIAPHAPAGLERLVTIGSAEYAALVGADPIA